MVRLLSHQEIVYGFQLIGGYVRTYHNKTADHFSRCTEDEFEQALKDLGWERADL